MLVVLLPDLFVLSIVLILAARFWISPSSPLAELSRSYPAFKIVLCSNTQRFNCEFAAVAVFVPRCLSLSLSRSCSAHTVPRSSLSLSFLLLCLAPSLSCIHSCPSDCMFSRMATTAAKLVARPVQKIVRFGPAPEFPPTENLTIRRLSDKHDLTLVCSHSVVSGGSLFLL